MKATNNGLIITVELSYHEAGLLSIIVDEYACRNRVEWAEEMAHELHNPIASTTDVQKGDR